ncbi:unnamed protein product [Penicillium salamii]|nr:unnamed protein product [Penicillium salamii]CAG8002049.1 unnamed protein product [Penicillium salamii]CAG8282234.1 unnamed protein product [Penicillium salamii]
MLITSRPCSNPGTTANRNSLTSESSSTTRQPRYHDTDPAVRSPTPGAMSASSNDGSNYHATQAKSVIQIDLHNPQHISRERQSLLKSALQLVSSIAESEPRHNATSVREESRPLVSDHIIPQRPSRELLYMLLPGPPESVRIQWPDHISDKTFARMATTLLRDDVDIEDQTFRQYHVCVYVKAIFHLYQASRRTDDPILKDELARSRSIYVAAAMRSAENFNILKAPDITTIQFLISSAFLMQHLGKPSQCWLFISYAARQITALNYHRIRKPPPASDSEQEIYDAVYWCYYLDRTLSSLLCRPPSLPDLAVSPTELIILDSASPYGSLLNVLLDLAQVQGKLHSISCGGVTESTERALQICQVLQSKMQAILPRLESSRDIYPKMVQYDWVGVDFCYHAIFVEIQRTRLQNVFDPAVHRECLLYARKSLKAFLFLQKHSSEMPGFDSPYPSFLTWTLFLYPLSAFFVVFCNIIGTVDYEDFQLMRQITQRLSPFEQDYHLGKLLNLLQSLERLCEPLFQEPSSVAAVNSAQRDTTADIALTNHVSPPAMPFADGMELLPEPETDPSADWLMWQLFNSQVPAGWLDKGFDSFEF